MDVSTSAKSNIHGGMSSKRMDTSACFRKRETTSTWTSPDETSVHRPPSVVRSSCALDERNSRAVDGCHKYATALAACRPSMS